MLVNNSAVSIDDSLKQGLTMNEAVMRSLVLTAIIDLEEPTVDGIDFSSLRLENKDMEVMYLDPVRTSCFPLDDDSKKCIIVVTFEYQFDEIEAIYSESDLDFDVKAFFKENPSIAYEVDSEYFDPELFKKLSDIKFENCEAGIESKCVLTLI